MATTRLMPLHVNKRKTAEKSLKDRLDYIENPEKTMEGELISSYRYYRKRSGTACRRFIRLIC